MRIFAVGTKILGGDWPTFGGPVPPGPNVEPPLRCCCYGNHTTGFKPI